MRISQRRHATGMLVVYFDPHDDTCQGAHDVMVSIMPSVEGRPYATLGWGPSVFLSIEGTEEFTAALMAATELAKQLRDAPDMAGVRTIIADWERTQ